MLKYLSYKEIDKQKWDNCVATDSQQLPYAFSWYLDIISPHWSAIVLNDYQAIFPVTVSQKWTIAYIAQPIFAQQLGLFGTYTPNDFLEIIQLLRHKFKFVAHLNLNETSQNLITNYNHYLFSDAKIFQNHTLDLSLGYAKIYENYSLDRKKNLKKGQENNWQVTESKDIKAIIDLFDKNHSHQIEGGIQKDTYQILTKLFTELEARKMSKLYLATLNGKIEAAAWFVFCGNRIIYLFNAASAIGRKGNARTILIDNIIKKYADEGIIFDFESPSIASIDGFYKSFGAKTLTFTQLKWNKLPKIINFLWKLKRVGSSTINTALWKASLKAKPSMNFQDTF